MDAIAYTRNAQRNSDAYQNENQNGQAQAALAMMLLLTLRGTPTMYYGDELGMENVPISPEQEVDPWGILAPGLGLGRDPVRTPMQWDASAHAGFSSAENTPWLPVADNYKTVNVAAQQAQPDSMLNLTQRLLTLRRESAALLKGSYSEYTAPAEVFAYTREIEGTRVLVVLNFSAETQQLTLPTAQSSLALTTYMDQATLLDEAQLTMRPNEGVILHLHNEL